MNQPVVIAGAGPVGLMLACELGLAGIKSVVLERLTKPRDNSPGMAINSATVELLQQRSLFDEVLAKGRQLPLAHFAHLPLDPTRVADMHPSTALVAQAHLEACLAERAMSLGAQIRYGHEVNRFTQHETGVTIVVRACGGEHTLESAYLIGCDGAGSTVRSHAGISFPGTTAPFYGLTAEVEVGPSHALLDHIGGHQYHNGIFTVMPIGTGVLRVSTGEFGTPTPSAAAASAAALTAHIRALTGMAIDLGSVRWVSHWHNETRHAESYRRGRILIAGDAAHVHFPLGGQALSTGVEDAVNLGWKLAATIAGHAPPGLLDTYHDERHPVGARACRTTLAQLALMYPMETVAPLRDLVAELTEFADVNDHLVRLAAGLGIRYPIGTHELAGCRLPNIEVTTSGRTKRIAELLQAGRGVVLDTTAASLPFETNRWAGVVDFVRVHPTKDLLADRVLIRPDGRVAWADCGADDDAGLISALVSWFGKGTDLSSLEEA
ncbi:FAD-dependent monooxygenase [Nocardia sp. NPDC004654]|uniref:FAD-dependent monooxygenase n=1 Tax=Nocardia sp. NPDC004654 TaxID=3154776 RepID=UPI0033B1C23C